MRVTLVSISRLTQAGCRAVFDGSTCQIFDAHKKLLEEVSVTSSLYCIQHAYQVPTVVAARGDEQLTMEELHVRLLHISVPTIREMMAKGMISGITLHPDHMDMGHALLASTAKQCANLLVLSVSQVVQ
jgi:hypothetical protein